ncbi:hypothetical protein JTB14_029812 [Gonioctena quinquepunctata]|nr:hypothetical protein JTB14_029812 [Gonioctena quinquepunctata]
MDVEQGEEFSEEDGEFDEDNIPLSFGMQALMGCIKFRRLHMYWSRRCSIRQYVKNEPRPVGLKNFVMTTSDGVVLDIEIYQGETTPYLNKTLGLGPDVVLQLVVTLLKISSVFLIATSLPFHCWKRCQNQD